MSFNVTFNNETKTFDKPVTVLDIVGKSKDIVCAYVNKRVRELTYILDKDSVVVPLTCKDRDAKPSYEASVRFLVAMAMHNIRPELEIRFSYNISRSIFMQILNPGVQSNAKLVRELEAEMQRIVDADLPLVRSIVNKDEEFFNIVQKKLLTFTHVTGTRTICIIVWFHQQATLTNGESNSITQA